ncbi:MAG: secretin N-terminal domain-containing protein [Candidatus Omnitrophota bacterium]
MDKGRGKNIGFVIKWEPVNFMERSSHKFIPPSQKTQAVRPWASVFFAFFLCFSGVTGVVFAADPNPATVAQKVSVPDATPAPTAPGTQAVPAPAAVAAPGPAAEDDTISLDFKDAEIGSVLRVLSMKSNVNIVTGPEVKGLVTVRLDNVPWEKALAVILRTYNYVFERDGNIIRVTSREEMKLEPVETKTFILNYSKAKEIQASVMDMLSERGKIKSSERSNMLVVTDIPTNLYRIGEVIKKLDKVTAQAFVDSKIVKTDLSNTEKLGINWNVTGELTGSQRPTTFPFTQTADSVGPVMNQFFPIQNTAGKNSNDPRTFPYPGVAVPGGNTFNYGTLDFSSFTAMLNFLETRTNTKVVSNPRVVVLNNQTATIQVGQEIPIPSFERNETTGSMEVTGFAYRNTGVVLNVTPHINSADEILVDLAPEVSAVGINQTFGTDQIQAPRFDTTKAKTQVLIQSGQTIAIGGLLSDQTGIREDKVPFLGDIPLVGKLFRSKNPSNDANPSTQKVETLFFVTVTTVDSQGQPAGAKVDGKKDQSKDDQAQQKTAATDAAPGVKDSEKVVPSENANKDKPA